MRSTNNIPPQSVEGMSISSYMNGTMSSFEKCPILQSILIIDTFESEGKVRFKITVQLK